VVAKDGRAGRPSWFGSAVFTGPSEVARLRPGDLLVIDEAGMLDQGTARALLTAADECGARVALLGDRHQLPAVGRGGVLDLAIAQTDPSAVLTLDRVHRFTRVDRTGRQVPDREYAELTLAMRAGADPGAVFERWPLAVTSACTPTLRRYGTPWPPSAPRPIPTASSWPSWSTPASKPPS
jgi:hypothetical protein